MVGGENLNWRRSPIPRAVPVCVKAHAARCAHEVVVERRICLGQRDPHPATMRNLPHDLSSPMAIVEEHRRLKQLPLVEARDPGGGAITPGRRDTALRRVRVIGERQRGHHRRGRAPGVRRGHPRIAGGHGRTVDGRRHGRHADTTPARGGNQGEHHQWHQCCIAIPPLSHRDPLPHSATRLNVCRRSAPAARRSPRRTGGDRRERPARVLTARGPAAARPSEGAATEPHTAGASAGSSAETVRRYARISALPRAAFTSRRAPTGGAPGKG